MGKYTVIRSKVIHLMNQLNSLREGNWKHTDNTHTLFNKLTNPKKKELLKCWTTVRKDEQCPILFFGFHD